MLFGYIYNTKRLTLTHFFSQFELILVTFDNESELTNRVSCVHNSSYSFIPIRLKLYSCLDQFVSIISQFELIRVSGICTKKMHVVWIYIN